MIYSDLRPHKFFLVAGLLGLLAVAGCTVGPDYRRPEPNMPVAWVGQELAIKTVCPDANDLARWWVVFGDPKLTSLMERSLVNNLDIRQAQARVRQARAALDFYTAGFWPTANAGGSYSRSGTGSRKGVDLFRAGLDAAWEIDLFGGVRRGVEAAEADFQATQEEMRGTLIVLAGDVALNYINLRSIQRQMAIARDTLEAQRHNSKITRQRFEGGLASELDVANADAQAASTAAQIPSLESSMQQTIYTLGVLLGQDPRTLREELAASQPIPAAPPEIPLYMPSELLQRRPDIRQAEAQLHAATARIGVATADLYPSFNLTGSLNYQNQHLSSLLNPDSRSWSVGPGFNWRIFDAGRIRANIEVQNALQEQWLMVYQKAILIALNDVESALMAYANERQRYEALAEAVTVNRKAVALSTKLYTEGQTDFLNVLFAQKSLYESQTALTLSTRSLSTHLVVLYKALGGGWDLMAGEKSPD